jgi:3-hydroxyacyl-CoA dehydrogenase
MIVFAARSRRSRTASASSPSVVGDKAGFIANALIMGYINHAVGDVREQVRDARRSSTPR